MLVTRACFLIALIIVLGAMPIASGCSKSFTLEPGSIQVAEIDGIPKSLAATPDGSVWFTYADAPAEETSLGRITSNGQIKRLIIARRPSSQVILLNQMISQAGNLWMTAHAFEIFSGTPDEIVKVTADGSIHHFPIPTRLCLPQQLAIGQDGSIWFAEGRSYKIGRLRASGIQEYPLPPSILRSRNELGPVGVATDQAGGVWFTVPSRSTIGKLSASGKMKLFITPTRNSAPTGIVEGPDSRMWFAEARSGKLGAIDQAGNIQEYATPIGGPSSIISQAQDLWIADSLKGKVCRFARRATFQCFQLPNDDSVDSIAMSADGSVWYAQELITSPRELRHMFGSRIGAVGRIDARLAR